MATLFALVLSLSAFLSLPAVQGCRYYCLDHRGFPYCCETGQWGPNASKAVRQRPGVCPPLRHTVEATEMTPCGDDSDCPYPTDKCCPDRALPFEVCKSPFFPWDNLPFQKKKPNIKQSQKTAEIAAPSPSSAVTPAPSRTAERLGECPPLRHTYEASASPRECLTDSQCLHYYEKCCPDAALLIKVCKRANLPNQKPQNQRTESPKTVTETTTKAPPKATTEPRRIYASQFPHQVPSSQPSYNPYGYPYLGSAGWGRSH